MSGLVWLVYNIYFGHICQIKTVKISHRWLPACGKEREDENTPLLTMPVPLVKEREKDVWLMSDFGSVSYGNN